MGLFSSIWKLIKRLVSKLVSLVKKIFKKLWPLLLIIGLIYFAPAIGTWFTGAGFPTIGGWFTTIGATMTPTLTSWLSTAWGGVASLAGEAWTGFKALSLGTQASIVAGAAALLAPDETAEVLGEVGEVVGDTVGSVVGGLVSGLPGWVWLAGGAALFLMLSRKSETVPVIVAEYGNELQQQQ